MKKIEFIKGIKMITNFYNKEFTQDQLVDWYMFFEDVEAEDFYKAIRKIARESKFAPTVNDLLENIKLVKNDKYKEIVELMKKDGYFHDPVEIEKTIKFIKENNIPSWLKADMDKYMARLLEDKSRLLIEN